jgi:hypothetical protein
MALSGACPKALFEKKLPLPGRGINMFLLTVIRFAGQKI